MESPQTAAGTRDPATPSEGGGSGGAGDQVGSGSGIHEHTVEGGEGGGEAAAGEGGSQ